MKYLFTWLFGFIIGAAAALAVLYVNPLTHGDGPLPTDGDTVFSYASPVTSELAFTHGGLLRLPSHPPAIPDLWEATINKSALSILVLRGSDGRTGAIASRFSYPAEDTDFLRHGALLNDEWIVSVPGQGSLLISAQSNWWPLLEDAVIPVWYLKRPWSGPSVYTPTIGPGADGRAIVHGASGRFARRSGTAAERYQLEEFDDRVGPRRAYAELYWRLAEDPAETVAD
jgi:hypothetical protein